LVLFSSPDEWMLETVMGMMQTPRPRPRRMQRVRISHLLKNGLNKHQILSVVFAQEPGVDVVVGCKMVPVMKDKTLSV
jgi:hypothetical protein